jgi:hypothetical protein
MSAMLRYGPWIAIVLAGCAPAPRAIVPKVDVGPVERVGLHNVFRLSERVFTGSSPEDERSFESLRDLEIRTIISVDGAEPDVEGAASFGLRYVHLPIGYDGVPEDRAIAIAKAIRDLPGPVYIHCHHGKHRGPAAAAAALRCLEPERSTVSLVEYLKLAGTDARYRGLFAAVERKPLKLDDAKIDYPARAAAPDLVRRMVELDETWDRVRRKPTAADALVLLEHYREMKRATTTRDERFQRFLDDAVESATELETSLRTNIDPTMSLKKSSASCAACHAVFRDNRVSSPP